MNLLYEDKDILVVEKPAGIPVETSRIGSKDMVSLLRNHLAETGKNPQDGIPYLGRAFGNRIYPEVQCRRWKLSVPDGR